MGVQPCQGDTTHVLCPRRCTRGPRCTLLGTGPGCTPACCHARPHTRRPPSRCPITIPLLSFLCGILSLLLCPLCLPFRFSFLLDCLFSFFRFFPFSSFPLVFRTAPKPLYSAMEPMFVHSHPLFLSSMTTSMSHVFRTSPPFLSPPFFFFGSTSQCDSDSARWRRRRGQDKRPHALRRRLV